MMSSSTTASTPPPPPPPVSTMVVCSRSPSSRSSAIGNSPWIVLLLWRNEPVEERFRSEGAVMRRGATGAMATAALALSACGQAEKQQSAPNAGQPVNAVPSEVPPPIPPPGTGPDARTPFGEPRGAVDPKSVEAAGRVVQQFGALIE